MHVTHLSLTDFRCYHAAELDLGPGATALVGANGQGKTNLVEAIGYVATLGSHRVATDAPLVRRGAGRAVVRAAVEHEGRSSLVEIEIVPGAANRARVNRAPVPRPRDVLGRLRTVLFAPEDLTLVKGDPDRRRAFLDDLLVARAPRFAGVRSDFERALRQRNALLKTIRAGRGGTSSLEVWDGQIAAAGAELLTGRLHLVHLLAPHVVAAYRTVADSAGDAGLDYRCSLGEDVRAGGLPSREGLRDRMLALLERGRDRELERGITLVGPQRDDLVLSIGELPARGYASHGESWSLALALRLGGYALLREDGDGEPVLVLDDVFAELDAGRRDRLAALVAPAEQVLVTAAVAQDVPPGLAGARVEVREGTVRRGDG